VKPSKPRRLAIPLLDYIRIFRVVNAVISSVGNSGNSSSLFFSVAGAALLKQFYGKDSRVLVGAAFYLLDDTTNSVLAVTKNGAGQFGNGNADSDRDVFHTWLECEGQILDFQAPLFPETLVRSGNTVRVPRKMFQKPRDAMSADPASLEKVGDFYLALNLTLTNLLVPGIMGHQSSLDLIHICLTWFVKPPKVIPRQFSIIEDSGKAVKLELSTIDLAGAW
jgi:hypothetical protein